MVTRSTSNPACSPRSLPRLCDSSVASTTSTSDADLHGDESASRELLGADVRAFSSEAGSVRPARHAARGRRRAWCIPRVPPSPGRWCDRADVHAQILVRIAEERQQHVAAIPRTHRAERRARERDDEAFGQILTHQTHAARADRGAHGEFVLAAAASRASGR